MAKYDNAIQVGGNIDFVNVNGKDPKDTTTKIEYSDNAIEEMVKKNKGHKKFGFKSGKYLGDLFPKEYDFNDRNYVFKVSLDKNKNFLIGPDNWVSVPCPDFCSLGD